jgi:beta-xylosidase
MPVDQDRPGRSLADSEVASPAPGPGLAQNGQDGQDGRGGPRWRDPRRPASERVADLVARMTLAEKVAQLSSVWLDSENGEDVVAPHQDDLGGTPGSWPELIRNGVGQLTRPFGTRPLTPADGAARLAQLQREVMAASRFGIPAIAHDECLAGFTAWQAAIYPVPLAWGATFDPPLVERMAVQIGASMRSAGVHQGLAPVLDVTVDPRWGRTEETIGEDPYLVGTIATAYVRGLESTGLVATLKHFAGYSASQGGRNLAPAAVTPRQVADLLLPPFEMAVRLGGARSVMHAYTALDGIPTAADPALLTGVLRGDWDFGGTVVSDYFGISFLELLHGVAGSPGHAAALALAAGVDVELPNVRCFGPPLVQAAERGDVDEALIDRALRRVLRQKCELGLLDPGWDPEPAASAPDLAPPAAAALARELAAESVVLLANDGILPLTGSPRIAVVGPRADDPHAMLGCYSFPSHVGMRYPGLDIGVPIPSFLGALREAVPGSVVSYAEGCGVDDPGTAGIAAAAELASGHDLCVAVLGDRSGIFGRGTSGEGCDAADLELPGVQGQLLEAVLGTGVPVIVVLLAGRPYALGRFTGAAAIVQAFFPGQEGGPALAQVLTGAVNPSGRLPVSVPRHAGAQPATYLGPALAQRSKVSSIDPTALYPFGFGLSYTSFQWEGAALAAAELPTDGTAEVSVTIRNVGGRAGTEVVQVYLHDPVAQVTRPVTALIGYQRVTLAPGESGQVRFTLPADLFSFTGRAGTRIVEPGRIELRLGSSSRDTPVVLPIELTGPERTITGARQLTARAETG